jgi:glucose-6-phosphate 1-dehydrogenase
LLPSHFACVGFARREKTDKEFQDEMLEAINTFSRTKPINPEIWKDFSNQLFYHRSEFHQDEGYETLNKRLLEIDKKYGTKGNRICTYQPASSVIIEKLHQHNLIYDINHVNDKWSRVIIENFWTI